MIRNLFLTLFLLAIAFPAAAMPLGGQFSDKNSMMASCHETAPPEQEDGKKQHPMAQHGCIGCIALAEQKLAPVPPKLRAISPDPAAMSALTGILPAPETPPPRA
jgi:hypothetical protein